MRDTKTIVRIQHGSHLYGTSTPASDQDFKSVHLPSGRAILMQEAKRVIDRKVKLSDTVKNQAGDIDDQSFDLQKFLSMVTSGDTVGTEILFAPDSAIVEMSGEWSLIQQYRPHLINRKCEGFVGYCQRQAAKYGIKGSRMAACEDIVSLLSYGAANYGAGAKLAEMGAELNAFCRDHEFSAMVPIKQQSGEDLYHLEVVDRKIPVTNTIKNAMDIYAKVYENYGSRARAAKDNEGIDWKAISHAVRVAGQAKELLETGHITFPRPDADLLLTIKQGRLPYSEVAPLLEGMVEDVNTASAASTLPEASSPHVTDGILLPMYAAQVKYD